MTDKCKSVLKTRDRGSALLIVLGFLSFMMISAVAFAVYMRIERQASSNFRHSASARHMLNSALFRSMEDVDYELRHNNDPDFSPKFPLFKDADGVQSRVLTSVTAPGDDSQNARVLTLDGLGEIPGLLVNHVREYAANDSNGAQWRSISMPYRNMWGEDAYNEAIVGRYAYACINVSDMLNVNNCKATARGSGSNQVSIAYLFDSKSQCDTFEKNREKTDRYYHTLTDFYACMFEHNDPIFYSPYHDLIDNPDPQNKPFDTKDMINHVLVTGGMVKAEPIADDAVNIFEPGLSQNIVNKLNVGADFYTALTRACPAGAGGNNGYKDVFTKMLADYLDTDHIPKSFDFPSSEIAPMVCQMSVGAGTSFPIFEKRNINDLDGDGNPDDEILINLAKIPHILPFSVKTVYPFLRTEYQKNLGDRYELEVEAYLRIHSVNKGKHSRLGGVPPTADDNYFARYAPAANHSFSVNTDIRAGGVNPKEPYHLAPLEMIPSLIGGNEVVIWDSKTGGKNGFVQGQPIVITLVVSFVGVKDSAGNYVDIFPNVPDPTAASEVRFINALHKPYFETVATGPLNAGFSTAAANPKFAWTSLETPDPRFNWKVSNWISSNADAQEGPNPSTVAMLADGTGRDGDIFMSVSNAGELQSPGELGFLIRPFKFNAISQGDVDFSTQTTVDQCDDHDAMFRTIRLYDQGGELHDDVFNYFYAADPDGFLYGSRVNPLSDVPNVLKAAIENVPMDYYVAFANSEALDQGDDPPQRDENFTEDPEFQGAWPKIVESWQTTLEDVIQNGVGQINIKRNFANNLRDVYFDNGKFKWYNPQRDTIFGKTFNNVKLYEVDRKMLYSYTLDSFSDNQQLFLYFISAEATAAAFGSRSRSVAGGKAVALVWRNPYPSNFKRAANGAKTPEPDDTIMFHDQKVLFFKYLD